MNTDRLNTLRLLATLFGTLLINSIAYSMNSETKIHAERAYTEVNPDIMDPNIRALVNQYDNAWQWHEAWLCGQPLKTGNLTTAIPLTETTIACFDSYSGKIKIFDIILGKCTRKFPLKEGLCATAPVKISDTILAFGQTNGTIALRNFLTGQGIGTYSFPNQHAPIKHLIKLSEKFLVSGSTDGIIIWDITDHMRPQSILMHEGISNNSSISRLSDTSFMIIERKVVGGKQTNIIEVCNLLSTLPSQKININIPEHTVITALTESTIICENHPYGFKIIDLETDKKYEANIQHNTINKIHLFKLSSNLLASRTEYELSIWDYKKDEPLKPVATLCASDQQFSPDYTNTVPLSSYSFACIDENQMIIYKPHKEAFESFNKTNFNTRMRLQALITQLRRLRAQQVDKTAPLQLTAWGEKWLAAMPEAIQKRLHANFNIKLLPEIG